MSNINYIISTNKKLKNKKNIKSSEGLKLRNTPEIQCFYFRVSPLIDFSNFIFLRLATFVRLLILLLVTFIYFFQFLLVS